MKKHVVRIALCAAAALCTSRSMSADLPWKYDTKDRPSDVSVTATATGSLADLSPRVQSAAVSGTVDTRLMTSVAIAGAPVDVRRLGATLIIR